MTPEHALSNAIRAWCGANDMIAIRYNVGRVYDPRTDSYIDFGPPVGHTDLIVYTRDGRAVFVECKIKPRKPTLEQLRFINEMKSRGFIAGVVYDLEDFINLIFTPKNTPEF